MGLLRPSWGVLVPPGASLKRPGLLLGSPWAFLEASWALGLLGTPPRVFLEPPGGLLGGLLGASWGLLGPSKITCFTIVFALLGPEESSGV